MSSSIYVTHVDKEGPFLKIWGQTERSLSVYVEKCLQQLLPQFEQGLFTPPQGSVQIGVLCCAKYKDGLFYRARITSIINQSIVEVHFIDFGNKNLVPVINIRTMTNVSATLLSVPPQAREFILYGIMHRGQTWDENVLAIINNEVRYVELQWGPIGTVGNYTLIKLFRNGDDITTDLITRGLVSSVTLTSQQQILHNFSSTMPTLQSPIAGVGTITPMQSLPTLQPSPQPTLLTYKLYSLEPGSEHRVYVSYVSDGPCHFSVQLQKLEDTLTRLMKEINRMPLQPLEDDPLPGTVCVARCTEDNHICRAVVTSVVDNLFKVFYVDFGNTELLSIDNLYQIPFKYVIPKVMAMRFCLASLDRSSITLEMKCAFKEFVREKLLFMRVLHAPARSALPLCELWDENNINVLDVIRRAALVAYPDPVQLTRGFSQDVHVSFVYSCNRFYVQLKSKEEELRRLMAELQVNCPNKPQPKISQIKIGQPCCTLFEADSLWYRAQILNIEGNVVTVRYVDYGNEEAVPLQNLRVPQGELLTVLRPQALECCLNGYQKMDPDSERDSFLEELILEKDFTMKVVEMQGSRALVDLTDTSRYNVASLLLEKIASAHSQVSPLLIQDGHKIEQRKRSSPTVSPYHGKSKDDRAFDRDKSRKPFGNRDQSNRGWGHQKDKPEKISNNNDNRSSTSSNDNASEDKSDWRKRTSQPRVGWKNDKRGDGFSKQEVSKEDSWGGGDTALNRNKFNRNKEIRSSEDRSGSNKFAKGKGSRDGWNDQDKGKGDGWGGQEKGYRNGWGNQEKGYRDKWNNQEKENKFGRNKRPRDDHFKGPKSPNFSDKSFSDSSEKNWRNRPRTSPRNDDGKGKGQGKGKFARDKPFWNSPGGDKSWNATAVNAEPLDLALPDASYSVLDLNDKTEVVSLCWFYDPTRFFCQLETSKDKFRTMMEEIQSKYHNRPPGGSNIGNGSSVIALFPEDNVLYRARVIEVIGSQWKVQYVDFGNVTTTDKIWPIEKKFMEMPIQAFCCGLELVPIENAWPDPDTFSSYFNSDSYTCNFLSFNKDKYIVDLYDNCVSIAKLLINASLAKSELSSVECSEPKSPPNVEIPLLYYQQISVTLSWVNKLDDFKVTLYNGQELQCSLHNLASAKQTWEDTLKQIVGCVIIIFIDDVIEERLEVTIYDTSGNKLQLIEPDEGAYDRVASICPMPVLTSTIVGRITHTNSHIASIQPLEFYNAIDQLLDSLFDTYDNTVLETPLEVQEGDVIAAHSADGNWYRGRVIGIDEEHVTVKYIDYGDSENINVSELRELSPEFWELHELTLEIFLSKPLEKAPETEVTVKIWYGENGWEGELIEAQEIEQETAVETEQVEVKEDTTYQENAEIKEFVQVDQEENPLQNLGIPVVLSHTDTPNEFYLQLVESLDQIENLQQNLQNQIPSLEDLENPTAGVLCAAQYSLDQVWYRCQVLDADADITSVRFIDYGNTDVLDNATTKVKTLPPDLLSLEQYAQRCSLCLRPEGDEWSQSALDRFEQLTHIENLLAKIIHQDEKTTYIELYAGGKNVSERLLEEGLANKVELEMESSCTGYISHLNSPSEFWIQLENSVGDLEWIAEQLSTSENFPELEDLAPGSLCAALFPEDEMWYRARILSNTVAGLEVIFIDYGNLCTCSGLRQLPEDLILLPPLALKCSLNKPMGIMQWSSQATEKFKEISADGVTIFNVHKITTGETSIVDLFLEGENIVNKLLPETVDGIISHFESVDNFWIQKSEDASKANALSEEMEMAHSWPTYQVKEENELIAALYPDDGKWYRAKILEERQTEDGPCYVVQYVDWGNISETTSVRMLTDELHKQPLLAINCKLDSLPGQRWTEESNKKLSALNNLGRTTFQIEFVSDDTVRLYLQGVDVRSDLGTVSASSVTSTPKKSTALNQANKIADDIVNEIYTGALQKLNLESEHVSKLIDGLNEDVSSDSGNSVEETYEESVDKSTVKEDEDKNESKEEISRKESNKRESGKIVNDVFNNVGNAVTTEVVTEKDSKEELTEVVTEKDSKEELTEVVDNNLQILNNLEILDSCDNIYKDIEIKELLNIIAETSISGNDFLKKDLKIKEESATEIAATKEPLKNVELKEQAISREEETDNENKEDDESIERARQLIISALTVEEEKLNQQKLEDAKEGTKEQAKTNPETQALENINKTEAVNARNEVNEFTEIIGKIVESSIKVQQEKIKEHELEKNKEITKEQATTNLKTQELDDSNKEEAVTKTDETNEVTEIVEKIIESFLSDQEKKIKKQDLKKNNESTKEDVSKEKENVKVDLSANSEGVTKVKEEESQACEESKCNKGTPSGDNL